MKTYYVQTTKTARYYTLGELNNSTEEIVFVFHGYAQFAKEFIQNFTSVESQTRFIIAPEGLNKFYFKDFHGKIGASWMTKEDRENEIQDYLTFLDNIYKQFSSKINKEIRITLFGFSQGGATASRWFVKSGLPNTSLILWGSSIPPDIDYNLLRKTLSSKIKIVIGDDDEFISEEDINTDAARLHKEKIDFELIKYRGKHNVQPGQLKELNLFK